MSDAFDYPPRPPFFANRAMRLAIKTCLANEIGAEGFTLMAVIALTEDAARYRRPVTFFNEQLMPLLGIGSHSTLIRVRNAVIAAGWLAYDGGGKGRPGKYFVTIPAHAEGIDDDPTDEGFDAESPPDALQNLERKQNALHKIGAQPERKRSATRAQRERNR